MTAPPEPADGTWPLLDHSRPTPTDDVLIVAIDLDHAQVDVTTLDERERGRAMRLQGEQLRRRHLAAHGVLRQLLGWRLGIEPARVVIAIDRHGKPSLRDHALAFNLSHSGGWALVALAADGEIGVDLELGERLRDHDQLAERMLPHAALTAFRALAPAQKPAAFLRAWTRKEAALKALGLGLPGGMEHVVIADDPLRLTGDHARLPGLAALHLHDLPTISGGFAAVCHGPRARKVVCRRWPLAAPAGDVRQLPSGAPS